MELHILLPLLRSFGVSEFKDKEVEIKFNSAPIEDIHQISKPASDAAAPADLGTGELMSADEILNWSASPSPGEAEAIPMTGDAPIEPPPAMEP